MTLEQIDIVKRMAERYPADFAMAYTAADIRRIHKGRKIASLIGIEGGHQINGSLAVLRQMYDAGARYMTLTHATNTPWADSATDTPVHNGLTPFGVEIVKEMNWLGMLVDLSHVIRGHHDSGAGRESGAGYLLSLIGARAGRSPAQRTRRCAACLGRQRRSRDGEFRASLRVGGAQSLGGGPCG